MPDAIHIALLRAVLDSLVFLEDSGDDIVDPDSAVRAMENIGHSLLTLSEPDRAELVSMINQLAVAEKAGPWRDFILNTPFAVGLVEGDSRQ